MFKSDKIHGQSDSLVQFSDLTFHSNFEKKAITNFVKGKIDTFDLFLAIDATMNSDEAEKREKIFDEIFLKLNAKEIDSQKASKKVKTVYSTIHKQFLQKYVENDYFPDIFITGNYNCVSASMLFALVFDKINIPYIVKVSSNHVYLVAYPGSKSIVVETTNPTIENAIFTGQFKQQYVEYLRTSKLISETDYRSKSVEEIFEENFKQVRDAEFRTLPGFQYYNKSLAMLSENKIEEAVSLARKAYYFFPDNQVKTLYYTALVMHMSTCQFKNVSDIDYLIAYSRFENTTPEHIADVFNEIIQKHLQYNDRIELCDSLYNRFISKVTNKVLIDEITFSYNLQMSYQLQNSSDVEKYITKALSIKENHRDANAIMERFIVRKLSRVTEPVALLDTVINLKKRYKYKSVENLLYSIHLFAILGVASDFAGRTKYADAENYLIEFEKIATIPIEEEYLKTMIEQTYRKIAVYHWYQGRKDKAKEYVNRGLRFSPNSEFLKSAVK